MLTMTLPPISTRPSMVAELICGSETTLPQFQQARIDRGFVFEDVEAGAAEFARLQCADQSVLVDHLAARRVDDIGVGTHQLQAGRIEQVVGRGRMRAIHRDDVDLGQHLVEIFPIGRLKLLLDHRVGRFAIVVVDFEAEGAGAARHRLSDAAHADDAEALAENAPPEHPGRRPAGPLAFMVAQEARAFREAAGHGEDQRHGHVGGVLGQHAGRVRDRDAAAARRLDVDVVDAGAELGDQAKLGTDLRQKLRVDLVGDGRDQDVGFLHRRHKLGMAQRMIVGIEAHIEQLSHARLDDFGKLAGDDDERFLGRRHGRAGFAF